MDSLDKEFIEFCHHSFDDIIFKYIAKKDRSFFYRLRFESSLIDELKDANLLFNKIISFDYANDIEKHERTIIKQGEKNRFIYQPSSEGLLYTIIISQFLNFLYSREWSDDLYSFRKGYSREIALSHLEKFLAKNDTEKLSLYKGDVSGYGDNIDQEILIDLIGKKISKESQIYQLLIKFVKILYRDKGSVEFTKMEKGIPTGSPLTPVFENIYLMELDRIMGDIAEVAYFRYGDDLLFVTPNTDQFESYVRKLKEVISNLKLEIKPEKEMIKTQVAPRDYFEWLGFSFNDSLRLTIRKKYSEEFKVDYKRSLNLMLFNLTRRKGLTSEAKVEIIQNHIKKLYDPFRNKYASKLIRFVTDDLYLKKIDSELLVYTNRIISRKLNLKRKKIWSESHKTRSKSLNYYRRLLEYRRRQKYHYELT